MYQQPPIRSYTKGVSIVVWCGEIHKQYLYYTHTEAVKLFKQEFNVKGKVEKMGVCPYVFN